MCHRASLSLLSMNVTQSCQGLPNRLTTEAFKLQNSCNFFKQLLRAPFLSVNKINVRILEEKRTVYFKAQSQANFLVQNLICSHHLIIVGLYDRKNAAYKLKLKKII